MFGPEDSWLFFGRDNETAELLKKLAHASLLAVFGNSGSGKSSLIRAGLIPALRRGRFRSAGKYVDSWQVVVFRPSSDPFGELAEALGTQLNTTLSATERADLIRDCKQMLPLEVGALRNIVAANVPSPQPADSAHVLLVADQFEELFTLTDDLATRNKYIDALLAAARVESALPIHVVLAVRADFYAQCLEHPELSRRLQGNLCNVPPMQSGQLRQAIENRLALAQAGAEAGLVDTLLADVGTEPGNLALLEHALGQLWDKEGGTGRALTSGGYSDIGRLRGALARHADEICEAIGDESDERLVRLIFLELVQFGDRAPDTRRRVLKESLLSLGRPAHVERLLVRLASGRLISIGGDDLHNGGSSMVEVSHEALIREWPRLRSWLRDDRDDLLLQRRLNAAAEEWEGFRRDSGSLLQGARLAQAEEWLARRPGFTGLEREFVEASRAAHNEAARRQREAEEREVASSLRLQREADARLAAEQRNEALDAENERLRRLVAREVAKAEKQFERESAAGQPLVDRRDIRERPFHAFLVHSHTDNQFAASLQTLLAQVAKPCTAGVTCVYFVIRHTSRRHRRFGLASRQRLSNRSTSSC